MLPGSVLPAELAYGPLVAALGSDAEVVMKDLEVYATQKPPSDYTLDTEVTVLREADARGWEQAFLVGYAGDPPAWMAKRPGGIRAFMETFRTYDLDRAALARFDRPVYFAHLTARGPEP